MNPSRLTSPSRRTSILLAEDDPQIRELFEKAFRIAGFSVRTAATGVMALVQIEQQTPDVLILDLDLPGVSGIDVLQELSARSVVPRIPVIVVTGTDWTPPAALVRAVLRKPLQPEELINVVRRAVGTSL